MSILEYWEKLTDLQKIGAVVACITVIILFVYIIRSYTKSPFSGTLMTPKNELTLSQPRSFPPINKQFSDFPPLAVPVVPEEIGLSQAYPQGTGVGMDNLDSNTFINGKKGPLLTDYTIPESYGESNLTDPTGNNGANQGARVIQLKNAGDQLSYKPLDESESISYSKAYSNNNEEVQVGESFINNTKEIKYSDGFNPENNLFINTSPGQESSLDNCEKHYPNVVKYNNFCITDGDIPYGKEINGKVNPRLVSRWESYTGNYSRPEALEPIDGLLYPRLNILTN